MAMWEEARLAMESVYDNTSFQDLVDREPVTAGEQASAPMYYL